jgi:hypothetical protein
MILMFAPSKDVVRHKLRPTALHGLYLRCYYVALIDMDAQLADAALTKINAFNGR